MTEVFGLPSFDPETASYRYLFFLRGVRHVLGAEEQIAALRPGDLLDAVAEPENTADSMAIRVHDGIGAKIGYVPNTLVEDVHLVESLGGKVEIRVRQVNPPSEPVQLRLLCELRAPAVDGYAPFSSERYKPLSSAATPIEMRPEELVG